MKKSVVLSVLLGLSCAVSAQQLVKLVNDKLVYTPYANVNRSEAVNVIPDFSHAGYRKGGVNLPEIPVVITLRPKAGDCLELIQKAIDELSLKPLNEKGFRGAILLKKGVYAVSGLMTVRASGVVLRGEGNGADGTVLVAMEKSKSDFLTLHGEGSGYGEDNKASYRITSTYIPTGTKQFTLENNHNLKPGDAILIQERPNDKWITDLDMAQYGWTADQYKMIYERTVTAVSGNTITIDIPFVDAIEEQYGGGVVYKTGIQGRITNSGVENLRIESTFVDDKDENHGWNAIVLKRAGNCWVKDVVAKYFGYSCVNISEMSVFNTVQDCAMIDPKSVTTGGRKYSFNIDHGSMGNLIQRCVTWGGRHDYVTGARVPGPNVFLDCVAQNTFADVGPHHRWTAGLLFDNIYGEEMRVQNRKAMGSGHGWAGVQTLFWNCQSTAKEIKVESPDGTMNWGIGCVGLKQNGAGYWESWGSHVSPRSLYLKQLEERLGKNAVNNVTTATQRKGVIWDDLKEWASQILVEERVIVQ